MLLDSWVDMSFTEFLDPPPKGPVTDWRPKSPTASPNCYRADMVASDDLIFDTRAAARSAV